MEKRERLDRRIRDVREALTSRDKRLQTDPARRQKVIQKAQQKVCDSKITCAIVFKVLNYSESQTIG